MVPIRKKYRLLFHNGSFKKKGIKVWYSKAQGKCSVVLSVLLPGLDFELSTSGFRLFSCLYGLGFRILRCQLQGSGVWFEASADVAAALWQSVVERR